MADLDPLENERDFALVWLFFVLGLVILVGGAELLVRSASELASAAGISPLVVGLTVVAYGTSAPELVVSIQSTLAGQSDVAIGNVVGSNIFNVLFILGISALIVPLQVSQQLIRFDVPLMVGLSSLLLLFASNGNLERLEGLLFTSGLVAYTGWAIYVSRKEQANILAEYEQEFGIKEKHPSWFRLLGNVVVLMAGLGMLVLGSQWFVDASVEIARSLGVSDLVIGLTIVAAGTSMPEVATSIMAAIRGERDIAVGNVIGSNIFNLLGVLGITSLISSQGVAVTENAIWTDIPVMVAVAIACLPIFLTGHLIARWEGCLFLAYYFAYTLFIVLDATGSAFASTFHVLMLGLVIPLTIITLLTGIVRHLRRGLAQNLLEKVQ